MKKILWAILIIVMMLAFAGCRNNVTNNGNASSETTVEYNKSQTDSTKEVSRVGEKKNINIKVDNATFTAALEDNATAKAFVKQLPLAVDMSELNGNEKYYNLPINLSKDNSSCPGTINEGDLMIYGSNCLVLFYKTFNTSYSYVKLGHINNTTDLVKALGSGGARVTFSSSD